MQEPGEDGGAGTCTGACTVLGYPGRFVYPRPGTSLGLLGLKGPRYHTHQLLTFFRSFQLFPATTNRLAQFW